MRKKDNPLDKPCPDGSANEFPELSEFCELLVKHSPHGIIVADASSTIVFVNDAYSRMTGRTRDDYIGARAPYSGWALEEGTMVEDYLGRASAGEFEPWETTLASKDGESFPVLVSIGEIRTKSDSVYYSAMVSDITERKRVEAQLRDGEEIFRRIAETSADAIYLIDVDGLITYVSPAVEEILGYRPEEFAGTRFGSHFRPEDLPVVEQAFRKNLGGEEVKNLRLRILNKNGDVVPIEVNSTPVYEADRVVGVQGIGRDVTEREKFEAALRRSEARFKAQYKGLPIPVYTWQKSGDDFELIDYNRGAEEITEGGIVDYQGIKATELFHDSPDIIDDMHQCYREKGNLQREFLYSFKTTKKSKQLFVSMCYVPPDLLLAHTQDVTARAEAERRLRESEARFRTAVDALPFGFFMLDNDGRYIMANDVVKSDLPDIIGLRLSDLQVDEGTKAIWTENNRRAFAGEVVQGEVCFEMGGEERVFHNIISPVYDGDTVQAILGVNIDITDRKRSEEALEMSRQQLRALAGRLHEVREEQSTSIAREIHDELGQALTGLRWELSWVQKRIGKAQNAGEKQQLEEKIKNMICDTDALIKSIRRISSELRPLILDDMGLVGAIEWQVAEFQGRTGIRCELHQDGLKDEELILDSQRATAAFRIFQEILTNVLRHSEATQVQIDLRREDDAGVIEVRDNGKGMPGGDVTEPSGLGILGMRERAQVFGGQVSIQSEVGKGTTVHVVIPVAVDQGGGE